MPSRKKRRFKLAEHVEIEHGLRAIFGKAKGTGVSNIGASPAPYDSIPDYAAIYYQPDDDPRAEDEAAARKNRREAMGVANRGKYGFHGTADPDDAPILRYESDDFPQNSPRPASDPEQRRAAIVTPNKYPKPTPTGPMPKLGVPADKFFGKVGTGAQVQGAGGGRRGGGAKQQDGGGVRFSETNEQMHSHKPKPQSSPNAPSVTKPKMIGDGGAEQPAVRDERAVRNVQSSRRPGVAQRMGR